MLPGDNKNLFVGHPYDIIKVILCDNVTLVNALLALTNFLNLHFLIVVLSRYFIQVVYSVFQLEVTYIWHFILCLFFNHYTYLSACLVSLYATNKHVHYFRNTPTNNQP